METNEETPETSGVESSGGIPSLVLAANADGSPAIATETDSEETIPTEIENSLSQSTTRANSTSKDPRIPIITVATNTILPSAKITDGEEEAERIKQSPAEGNSGVGPDLSQADSSTAYNRLPEHRPANATITATNNSTALPKDSTRMFHDEDRHLHKKRRQLRLSTSIFKRWLY